MLGSWDEVHLLIARLGDVSTIFGPHDLFLSGEKWIRLNGRVGGLMALANQMDEKQSFFYYIFREGVKQTDAIIENGLVRILPDEAFTVSLGGEKIYEHRSRCSLSESQVSDFIRHDLAISARADGLAIVPRLADVTLPVEGVAHMVFRRGPPQRSLFGLHLGRPRN